MKFTTRVKNAVGAFSKNDTPEVAKNSNSPLSREFFRSGSKNKPLLQDWSQVEMSDQDMYTGYSYAAIKKRANRASALGKKFLYTEASKEVMAKAKEAKNETEIEHPYLTLIKESTEFTRRKFWHDISTYLDLEGVYYLMAVRAVAEKKDAKEGELDVKVGAIQKLVMLNPYNVRRVVKKSDGTIGAYIESKNGRYREIPKEMIIEIRLLNPFNNDEAYSMTDAAKESQFTMKQAGDYTRHSIKGNINAPGAITTDVELDDNIFDNFVARIRNHSKGEPLYGNGAGSISYTSMQVDLDKAALDKINEIHRSILFAVSGTSKTTLGIEESGTTRDTSQVQKDNFTEDAVMPQIEDIIDALNLDYRKYYNEEWQKNKYEIVLDNPLESDREAELKDIEIRETELNLRQSLIDLGYEYEIAAKYAHGDISLEKLGEPTLEVTEEATIEPEKDEKQNTETPNLDTKKQEEEKKPKEDKTTKNTAINKEENAITSHDIPDLYDGTGVDPSETGIVLLRTEKIPVLQFIKDNEDDIYYGDEDDSHFGVPAEEEPHLTLLQGFLENANNWKDKVDKCLDGWKMPTIIIEEVSYFERDDYVAIVGLVKKTDELIDGHERLTLLPHISEFSEYLPHVTLVYIKKGTSTNKWVKPLAKKYNGQKVAVKGLDYGDKPEKKVKKKNSLVQDNHNALVSDVEVSHSHDCNEHANDINSTLEKAKNALNPDLQNAVIIQESDLYTATQGLEADMANAVIFAIRNGNYQEAEDLISESQEKDFAEQLRLMLATYYLVLMPIYAKQLLDSRLATYNKQGIFAMTSDVEEYIATSARKASESHVNTVKKDLLKAFNVAEKGAIKDSMVDIIRASVEAREEKYLKKLPVNPNLEDIKEAINSGKFDTDKALYKRARELAREGEGLESIARAIRNEYQDISVRRATTIARHETNRVFNMAQYQADVQFLTESNLMDSAYKVLRNRADDPCPICAKIIEDTTANPIPFQKNFVDLGETISANYKKTNGKPAVQTMTVNYEAIKAGNVHVNCRCEYVLVIKQEDGTFLNSLDLRIDNSKGYNPYRDSKGRFASGPSKTTGGGGGNSVDISTIKTKESFNKHVEEAYWAGTYGSYPSNVEASVRAYQGSYHEGINDRLRAKDTYRPLVINGQETTYMRTVTEIDSAFNIKTAKKSTLYRGTDTNYHSLPVGSKITNRGYSSTSSVKERAEGFQSPSGSLLIINTPKDSKVALPDLLTIGQRGRVMNEQEILLPRGAEMTITKIKDTTVYVDLAKT